MAISISGSNSISGLGGNDTDFDKVLENLKKIESSQLNRLESWKSDWKLRYDAFTQIIEQVQAANSMLSQLANKNNFVTKNVQSNNENIITAVANASAQDVQHTIKVSQTASQAIWANTGKVFSSKTDSINTTGSKQEFKYRYAGKDYSMDIPANTSLDSFASMVNNAADNPGIKVSLIQTGSGYVFQIAGKDTGVENDLYIYPGQLEGMKLDSSSTSIWQTNNSIKPGDKVTNPSDFVFDLVMQDGTKKSITVKGDLTPDKLVEEINRQTSAKASWDGAEFKLEGAKSITRRKKTDDTYVPASTRIELAGDGNAKFKDSAGLGSLDSSGTLEFTVTLDDGKTRKITLNADATNEEVGEALSRLTGSGVSLKTDKNGKWGLDLSGVKNIVVNGTDTNGTQAGTLTAKTEAAKGVRETLGASVASSELTLSFDDAKLSERLDGKAAGDPASEDFVLMLVDKDGEAKYVKVDGDATYGDLLKQIEDDGYGTREASADGKTKIKLNGYKEANFISGSLGKSGGMSIADIKTTTSIPGVNSGGNAATEGSLFYQHPTDGSYTIEKEPDLEFTITTNDGKTGVIKVPSGSTMQQIVYAIKSGSGVCISDTWTDADGKPTARPKLDITYVDKDGKQYLKADGNPANLGDIPEGSEIYLNFNNIQSVTGTKEFAGQVVESSNWNIQKSANAKFQIDNWPVEMESATNNISDVIEGVVFDIHEVGEARISVSTDITSVEQSIQNYLDAVNSVLLTVNELMKFDESKEVTSNDPNDIGNDNYSQSGLTNQKGGLLTGNYGVQLFKSRFSSLITATPPGFKAQSQATDILSGDVLASLANLGIKTDTDTTSDTYGLLVLAPSSSIAQLQTMDQEHYEDMITNHLEAVVDFFCASGIGSSTSTDFRYGSHVEGITKAGVYDVSYSVDADGNITKVMIGGVEATRDMSQPGNYYSVASGDAKGLSVLIDNLEPGDHPPAGETMQVRIKQGLVQTTQNFLKAELIFNDVNISANSTPDEIADAVYLKSQNGALMSLRDNYMKVMESIDVKIEREQRRIDTWYQRQKQIFANLETLLKQYDEQQKSLEGQLKQLSGNN